MNRKIALVAYMLLLCGCNGSVSGNIPTNDIPDIIESAESAGNPETHETVQPSAEPAQSSPSPTDTAEPKIEFDDSEWIKPKLSPEKVGFTFSCGVSAEKIKEYAENVDFDVTALDYYESCVDKAEKFLSGDELKAFRARSYMWEIEPEFCYIGTDEADWLAKAEYCLFGSDETFLTRLFLIKDGEIIRELDPIEDYVSQIFFSDGEIFISRRYVLQKVKLVTGDTSVVCDNYRKTVIGVNEEYIVLGGERVTIIVRETGEIIDTGIESIYPNTIPHSILSGDIFDCMVPRGDAYRYDITERTLTEGDHYNLGKIRKGALYSDKWSVIGEETEGRMYLPAVRVVNLYDGTERVYDLRVFDESLTGYYGRVNNLIIRLDGDMLWIYIRDRFYALNLNTGEAAEAEPSLDFSYIRYTSQREFKLTENNVLYAADNILYVADVDYPV